MVAIATPQRSTERDVSLALSYAAQRRPLLMMQGAYVDGYRVAQRVRDALPPLSQEAETALRVARGRVGIDSEHSGGNLIGVLRMADPMEDRVPLRYPHHTISYAAMCGRGKRPGELDLACGGILVLQDLPDWSRSVIEGIGGRLQRWSVESGRPLIMATSWPCPCHARIGAGWGEHQRPCRESCTESRKNAWATRLGQFCSLLGIVDSMILGGT